MTANRPRHEPLVAVVDFHHARGPEIERWFGAKDGSDPGVDNDWSLLPFMALSDGAHTATEDFSYFTLRKKSTETEAATSLFGISCTRQIATKDLINKSEDVTRSTVQKAVVVVTDSPQHFGHLRERLSVVTSAWFAQKDFSDADILKHFQESLVTSLANADNEKDQYLGLSLREMIYEFKYQTLVLFKCCLLQPKMLFFSSRCERLCMIQFSLISLIPGLVQNLQDCADPALESYAQTITKPTSLKTSDRSSLLAYMGLPLQLFGKGSLLGPYTPLQQLDLLADSGTKSYIVGSTNSLLLQQKDKYSDILINLDDLTVNVTSASLRTALSLSAADRRWIDFLAQTVTDTWDPAYPSRPKTMGYMGSEEFIRLQFEEYLLALLSCVSYHEHLKKKSHTALPQPPTSGESTPGAPPLDPSVDFGEEFMFAWAGTTNYALFESLTKGSDLFDIITPRHPTAGGLSVEDIQRRLAQQVSELHLDERMKEGREALNKTLATGQKHFAVGKERVSEGLGKLWADIEAMRETQRKKSADRSSASEDLAQCPSTERPASINSDSTSAPKATGMTSRFTGLQSAWSSRTQNIKAPAVDIANVQERANAAKAQAGAYLSSWGSWANSKKNEWQTQRVTNAAVAQSQVPVGIVSATTARKTSDSQPQPTPTATATSGPNADIQMETAHTLHAQATSPGISEKASSIQGFRSTSAGEEQGEPNVSSSSSNPTKGPDIATTDNTAKPGDDSDNNDNKSKPKPEDVTAIEAATGTTTVATSNDDE